MWREFVAFASGCAAVALIEQGCRHVARRRSAGDPADLPLKSTPALELHAVLNVFNRLTLALMHDEVHQEGLDRVSRYLCATHRFGAFLRSGHVPVEEAVGSYWRMTRWMVDPGEPSEPAVAWRWNADARSALSASPALAQALVQALVQALRALEGVKAHSLTIRIGPLEGGCDSAATLTVTCQEPPVSGDARSPGAPWTFREPWHWEASLPVARPDRWPLPL